MGYRRLVAYHNEHKSTSVPRDYKKDTQLGKWVDWQRFCYRNNELSVERINYLESIGFIWKFHDLIPWIEMYERLVAYKQLYQSTLVPTNYITDLRLGMW